MKTFLQRMWALGAIALVAFSLFSAPEAQARPGDRVSFQTFYDELDPYGRWINDPEYGYVWSPDVERDFQPYGTRGHWVMTEYGNTWVSDYDWGWAPFHYGRWMYDDFYGWLWVPGSEWGPAWVNWRNGGGYYGWAPMGPRVTYVVAPARWVFVPVMYITSPRIYNYCVPRTRVVNIYHDTTIINNYYERDNRKYVYGPRTHDIERATNRRVNVYRVDRDSRPGRTSIADNSVRIYRPDVNSRREEAPARAIARNNATNRSSLTDTNSATVGRSDRSSNTDRSRAGIESGSYRRRSSQDANIESGTSRSRRGVESNSEAGTYRRRSSPESSTEQRSIERGSAVREGVREREGVRGTTSESGEYSNPTRSRRSDYPQPSSETNSTGTRTRTFEPQMQQRSSEPQVQPQRPEGSYSPRRSESTLGQEQYPTRSTRQESSVQGQYQQRSSRQESAPTQAPVQRQATPRQESPSGGESGRRSRN